PRPSARIALACSLALAALTLAACAQRRPVQDEQDLLRERAALKEKLASEGLDIMTGLIERMRARRAKDPGATLDVLAISGGGAWGAFGTGLLRGWGEVQDPAMRRPQFDVVSGVSTGALIAPFAFLGTERDLETVDQLYRNPKADWVRTRGILFFLPDNASFAEVPGLEREIDEVISDDFIRRVAEQSAQGRVLLINTTNLDDGSPQPFRWGKEAQAAVAAHDPRKLRNILLASSGIPGAFPPREIDGSIYVDGAVTSNIIYGGNARRGASFGAVWKRMYPGEPVPTVRFWVILNNYAQAQPRTVQPTWPSVIERSLEVAVRASTTIALRHLYAMTEAAELRGEGKVEVRWVAIPSSWKAPEEGIFKAATMRSLSDLGMQVGRDPASWQSESP
ncbi:MAG: patatin-like phospholipase family protein, partial [Phycisphaerales bacterium]